MIENVPNVEPLQITAGDTAIWRKDPRDYISGDGWALSYVLVLRGIGVKVLFTGVPDGSGWLVTVAAGQTAGWAAGEYDGQGYVTRSGERHLVWRGTIEVLTNFGAEGDVGDTRSKAKIILDFIDASFAKLAQKQTVEAKIEGVELKFRSLKELTEARNYWGTIYRQEQTALSGYKSRRTILARFVQPR